MDKIILLYYNSFISTFVVLCITKSNTTTVCTCSCLSYEINNPHSFHPQPIHGLGVHIHIQHIYELQIPDAMTLSFLYALYVSLHPWTSTFFPHQANLREPWERLGYSPLLYRCVWGKSTSVSSTALSKWVYILIVKCDLWKHTV